jgi:hypothetical protein
MTAVQQKRRLTALENIMLDRAFSETIVAVYGKDADVILFNTFDIVKIIEADHRSLRGVISSGIDRRRVVSGPANVVNLIIFDDMIVTHKVDRHVRGIVNTVMAAKIPNAIQGKRRLISRKDLRYVMDMIILQNISGWDQLLTVTSIDNDTTASEMVHNAPAYVDMVTVDHRRIARNVFDLAIFQGQMMSRQCQRVTACCRKRQALEGDIRCILHRQNAV